MSLQPIIVSGAHRSGTTWVGRVLENSKELYYVHEPFNIGIDRKNSPLKYWNECITEYSDMQHQKKVLSYLRYFYALPKAYLVEEIKKISSMQSLRDFVWSARQRLRKKTILKDPIAIFSLEWIYAQTQSDVIIMVRHPAAFIGSLVVKNWNFDFHNFLEQENLMDSYLSSFKSEIEDKARGGASIVEQGILLWNCIYHVVNLYEQKYHDYWKFYRHEDISLEPHKYFEDICNYIEVSYSEKMRDYVTTSTTTQDSGEHDLIRNSKRNIHTWKTRLKPEEISKIKEKTREVWTKFYTEEDW